MRACERDRLISLDISETFRHVGINKIASPGLHYLWISTAAVSVKECRLSLTKRDQSNTWKRFRTLLV